MRNHIAAAMFGLSLFAIIINTTLHGWGAVYIGAILTGTLGTALIVLGERKPKGPPASAAEEILRWTRERDNLRRALDNARAEAADDRIAFLEPKLAEAEATLRKLG